MPDSWDADVLRIERRKNRQDAVRLAGATGITLQDREGNFGKDVVADVRDPVVALHDTIFMLCE